MGQDPTVKTVKIRKNLVRCINNQGRDQTIHRKNGNLFFESGAAKNPDAPKRAFRIHCEVSQRKSKVFVERGAETFTLSPAPPTSYNGGWHLVEGVWGWFSPNPGTKARATGKFWPPPPKDDTHSLGRWQHPRWPQHLWLKQDGFWTDSPTTKGNSHVGNTTFPNTQKRDPTMNT